MKSMKLTGALAALLIVGSALSAHAGDIKTTYKVGSGTTFEDKDGNFKVKMSTRIQSRYTFNNYDSSKNAKNDQTFSVPRVKFAFEGFTLADKLRFKMQLNAGQRAGAEKTSAIDPDAITKESTSGLATLEDAWLDYVPYSYVGIKVGQFKVPFTVQEMTSSGKQQFVDRSQVNNNFTYAYDTGAAIHGNLFHKKANYSVFAVNGEGANNSNVGKEMLGGVRLEYIPLGEYVYSESDTENSQDPNLGFGVTAMRSKHGKDFLKQAKAGETTNDGALDGSFKYKGFSLFGTGLLSNNKDTSTTNYGYLAQVGYFFVPQKFEVALRTDGTLYDSSTVADTMEHSIGLNYFVAGHGIKVQADYSALQTKNSGAVKDTLDNRVRAQLQVIF